MNPTSRFRSVLFWVGLAFATFVLLVARLRHGLLEPQHRAGAGAERVVISTAGEPPDAGSAS